MPPRRPARPQPNVYRDRHARCRERTVYAAAPIIILVLTEVTAAWTPAIAAVLLLCAALRVLLQFARRALEQLPGHRRSPSRTSAIFLAQGVAA
jgi:hypothetical protein